MQLLCRGQRTLFYVCPLALIVDTLLNGSAWFFLLEWFCLVHPLARGLVLPGSSSWDDCLVHPLGMVAWFILSSSWNGSALQRENLWDGKVGSGCKQPTRTLYFPIVLP
jgi:hypothetical protein